ncbi:MAG: glycosyltransferase [candidate division NC10 bacterium]|nr:glycosyltransferase [candidate division NC10 bacterium]
MTGGKAQVILSEAAEEAVKRIQKADILVGIPSYNNAKTIGQVVQMVSAGLAKYFPQARSVIVNSDGGSQDGTPQVVEQVLQENPADSFIAPASPPIEKIVTPYQGIPGKGSAFRTIFKIAEELQVSACAVFDADLRSITPEWVERLIRPVYEGSFDYVAPLYRRHKYDGTITNSIVYPLTRTLYGKRLRQPIGGDFGFSGKLAGHYLSKDVWETDVARFGVDIWMTTTALAEGYRVCQAYLGAKVHDPKDPGADLAAMLMQVMGAMFTLMEEHQTTWQQVRRSEPVPTFGVQQEVGLEPVQVNVERMVKALRQGLRDLLPVWEIILPTETLSELLPLGLKDLEEFRFPPDLWVRVIYDFALASHERVLHWEHLLKSLTPLYLGRTASFVLETKDSTAEEVEESIEALCEQYEAMKPYLVGRWR